MIVRQISVLLAALVLGGCATQQVEFRYTSSLPAARGAAKISLDDNGNAVVRVEFEHLAPPARLIPARSIYVLWAQDPQGTVAMLGQLVVDKDLDGSFRGSTAMKNFRLVITAEDLATPARPSQPHMMTTEFIDASVKKWYQMR